MHAKSSLNHRMPPVTSRRVVSFALSLSLLPGSSVASAGYAQAPKIGTREVVSITTERGLLLSASEYVYVAMAGNALETTTGVPGAILVPLRVNAVIPADPDDNPSTPPPPGMTEAAFHQAMQSNGYRFRDSICFSAYRDSGNALPVKVYQALFLSLTNALSRGGVVSPTSLKRAVDDFDFRNPGDLLLNFAKSSVSADAFVAFYQSLDSTPLLRVNKGAEGVMIRALDTLGVNLKDFLAELNRLSVTPSKFAERLSENGLLADEARIQALATKHQNRTSDFIRAVMLENQISLDPISLVGLLFSGVQTLVQIFSTRVRVPPPNSLVREGGSAWRSHLYRPGEASQCVLIDLITVFSQSPTELAP